MNGPPFSDRLKALGSAFAFILFLMFALCVAAGSAAEQDQDLICPENEDCYPKIFQATDEFQVIREGQEIPHGLHVRLDVTTGKKEAKLNDPNEEIPELEGLPVDSSMVIVETDEGSEEVITPPKGAPKYEAVGKVKPPQDENQAFYDSLTVLKTLSLDDRPIDAALSVLKDIAHDIYYGLKVAEDANAVKELLCMMSSQDLFTKESDNEAVTQAGDAAYIIGSALQNNQKALAEVEKSWAGISQTNCAGTDRTLSDVIFNSLMPDVPASSDSSTTLEGKKLSLTKAKSSALRGLIKSPLIRDDFLANGGMAQILQVLTLERPELVPDQQKLANLVMDNFLDEDMGATLGVWPRAGDVDHDWHKLKDVAKKHRWDKGHWSGGLWKMIQAQKTASRAAPKGAKPEL